MVTFACGEQKILYVLARDIVERMKPRSWYLIIGTVLAVLILNACASQEGVAPNPGEMPDRPGAGHTGIP
jgi:hypothetical protein